MEERRASGAAATANGGDGDGSLLLSERVAPRKGLPPLLVSLQDRKPQRLHYLGERERGGATQAIGGGVLLGIWREGGREGGRWVWTCMAGRCMRSTVQQAPLSPCLFHS